METLCYHVKPEVYSEDTIIIKKEEKISKMLFIVQGRLKIEDFAIDSKCIRFKADGYFFGKELQQWVFSGGSSLPTSNRLVRALTKVEAFVLESNDLERNYAAMVFQSKWQHRKLRKIAWEAVERKERKLW